MELQTLNQNLTKLLDLLNQPIAASDSFTQTLMKQYLEKNLTLINDVILCSIEHLKKVQHAALHNDVICVQASFTHEMGKNLMYTAEKFVSASLDSVSDYNDWLKAKCDVATTSST